jgi:hypothetical protein
MSRFLTFAGLLVATLVLSMAPTPVGAYTYDKLTYLTFSGPVQIPGVTLDTGTYRFRMANPSSGRNVIQVLSHDGTIVHAMFHTMADSRTSVTEEPTVTFRETPVGVAPALKSLFWGGEHAGYEFVYPKGGPDMTVRMPVQPEITYTAMPAVAVAEAVPEEVPEIAPTTPDELGPIEEPVAAPELPSTASPVPLVGVSGLGALVLALGVGLLRRRFN